MSERRPTVEIAAEVLDSLNLYDPDTPGSLPTDLKEDLGYIQAALDAERAEVERLEREGTCLKEQREAFRSCCRALEKKGEAIIAALFKYRDEDGVRALFADWDLFVRNLKEKSATEVFR